jgi:hypothetical protein
MLYRLEQSLDLLTLIHRTINRTINSYFLQINKKNTTLYLELTE